MRLLYNDDPNFGELSVSSMMDHSTRPTGMASFGNVSSWTLNTEALTNVENHQMEDILQPIPCLRRLIDKIDATNTLKWLDLVLNTSNVSAAGGP